jgi:hypothetical protein
MVKNMDMNQTTMLGTYTLDGDVPVQPEIVLANCTDTARVGQLVSAFQGLPDIRFFLIENVDENAIDLNADFHFLKDGGNWILANHNTMMEVLFDDAGFNPVGSEGTFALNPGDDGSWSIVTGDEAAQSAHLPPSEQLLVDMGHDDIFAGDSHAIHVTTEPETFFVDPSVLAQGEHEILVANFTIGHDTLELPEGLSIKDVVVDTEHDLTEVIISGADNTEDFVVKLMGMHQPDLPGQDYAITSDTDGDDLIHHMINSGLHGE